MMLLDLTFSRGSCAVRSVCGTDITECGSSFGLLEDPIFGNRVAIDSLIFVEIVVGMVEAVSELYQEFTRIADVEKNVAINGFGSCDEFRFIPKTWIAPHT